MPCRRRKSGAGALEACRTLSIPASPRRLGGDFTTTEPRDRQPERSRAAQRSIPVTGIQGHSGPPPLVVRRRGPTAAAGSSGCKHWTRDRARDQRRGDTLAGRTHSRSRAMIRSAWKHWRQRAIKYHLTAEPRQRIVGVAVPRHLRRGRHLRGPPVDADGAGERVRGLAGRDRRGEHRRRGRSFNGLRAPADG